MNTPLLAENRPRATATLPSSSLPVIAVSYTSVCRYLRVAIVCSGLSLLGACGGGSEDGTLQANSLNARALAVSKSTTDYFVSPSGDDANDGRSKETPWKSIGKVNQTTFLPSERILFRGGAEFHGTLSPNGAGTAGAPIEVASYGNGRAVIHGGEGSAMFIYNAAGFFVHDINFTGSGSTIGNATGVAFYTDLPDSTKLQFIKIQDVDISGFGGSGLEIGSWNGATGYNDVLIERVQSHDNGGTAGIQTYAQTLAHTNVRVRYSVAYNNTGRAGLNIHSGSGIVLSQVDGGVIERSIAHHNGALNTANGGPIGIWAYESNRIVIQHNESYMNKTNSQTDGGGFDLDGGITNSVMQYNYSHDNDGAGYLVCEFLDATRMTGNVVRYNVSHDDGRKNNMGAITIYGTVGDADIYNNTVLVSAAPHGVPAAVWVGVAHGAGVRFKNNVFVTTGGIPLLRLDNDLGMAFQGNAYWAGSAPFVIQYQQADAVYGSLAKWRNSNAQEFSNGVEVGIELNPGMAGSGRATTVGDPDRLALLQAYRLLASSPLIDRGLDVADLVGNAVAGVDFFGRALPKGGGVDIGAHEYSINPTVPDPLPPIPVPDPKSPEPSPVVPPPPGAEKPKKK